MPKMSFSVKKSGKMPKVTKMIISSFPRSPLFREIDATVAPNKNRSKLFKTVRSASVLIEFSYSCLGFKLTGIDVLKLMY